MDQAFTELLKVGVVGAVAIIFIVLYLGEKKDHQKTRDVLISTLNGRLEDSKKTTENITEPLRLISQGINLIGDKIEISKGRL